jgi:colanic acid biosynthesis glycosyl transferase WcaI
MRITLINQFYRPDLAATAHLAASLAEHLARGGHAVTVVTGGGGYVALPSAATPSPPPPSPEASPRVLRLWTPGLGKGRIHRRLIDYACYYVLAALRAVTLSPQDIVVSLTTPPYIAWAGVLHKLLHPRRTKLVLWNMDCYPDAAERVGMIRVGGAASRVMRALNRALFRRLDHLVAPDKAMLDLLCSQYAPSGGGLRGTVIPNWEDAALFPRAGRPPAWPAGEAGGLRGKFVVLYLGNAGIGHAFDTALDAAALVRDASVVFLFVGGGSRFEEIRRDAVRRGLTNVVLHGYVAKERTPEVLASADCALITLRDEALGVVSPSKLHSSLAAGLPVLYIGPEGSNVDDAIRRFACGVSLRHGEAGKAAAFLRGLTADPARAHEMREKARRAFEEAYCDLRALPQFDAVLASVAAPGPRAEAR